MRVAVFSTKSYDRNSLETVNQEYGHELMFYEARLTCDTYALAKDFPAVCVFVNDRLDNSVIEELAEGGTRLIALRCAGYNNVDLKSAAAHGIQVVRVPAYSPYAVAEHTVALLLTLNRKVHRAFNRVRESNFALEGLLGFDVHGLTVGVIGTGRIGIEFARIMQGFGCPLLGYDVMPNPEAEKLGLRYVEMDELLSRADILSLHCPLTPQTYHLVNAEAIEKMKTGVTLINTSRGALVDTSAVIEGLKSGKIGYLGLDVYEEEGDLFFEDLSNIVLQDDVFARLLVFPNVIITGHQAFFTRNALDNIAHTTLANILEIEQTGKSSNLITG